MVTRWSRDAEFGPEYRRGEARWGLGPGLSERRVHRCSLVAFGYQPKTLGRVLRFDRPPALARRVPLAETTARAG